MSTYINDKQYNDVIDKLQYYMLDENTINRAVKTTANSCMENKMANKMENKINKYNKIFLKEENAMFTPKQKDNLFWCFYILKYGEANYEMLDNINIVFEKKLNIIYLKV